jgi:transcriptional regulator with XRE-family HTH domain
MHDFAKRLRRLRQERGITRYRLSKLSGISKEGVSKLELPGSNPRLSTLLKVAKALGVSPAELLPEAVEGGRRTKKT